MKRKLLIQGGIAMVVLLVLALGVSVGQAYATTGCFTDTNGHWAETFICWMSDNGITTGTGPGVFSPEDYVTRAQMSVFMQRTHDLAVTNARTYDASITSGQTYIIGGLNEWQPNGNYATTAYVRYYSDYTVLSSTTAGIKYFQFTESLPGSLYGHENWLRGVQICYDAGLGASLTTVTLEHHIRSGTDLSFLYKTVTDATVRTDSTCRTYNIADPIGSLWGNNHVVLYVAVNFADATKTLRIASTTFIIEPSASAGSLNSGEIDQAPVIDNPQPSGSDTTIGK